MTFSSYVLRKIDLEKSFVPMSILSLTRLFFMQVPHRLSKEVLGVIYMCVCVGLQSSLYELVFDVKLGKFISFGIRAILALVSGPSFQFSGFLYRASGVIKLVLCMRTYSLKGSGIPASIRQRGLGCYLYGFAVLP